MMDKLLTVEEFAKLFRTTTTTVYRWLKEGKIQGVKIGKEWRIKENTINEMLKEGNQQEKDNVIWGNLNINEHLLVIAESREQIFELEASFFQYAIENGKNVMKGCWWQDPDEVESHYKEYGLDTRKLAGTGKFKLYDFSVLYKKHGISGPIEAWHSEIMRHRRNELWASGSPSLNCFQMNAEELLIFEEVLHKTIQDMPIIGICPYTADEFEGGSYNNLRGLINYHSGVIYYDEHNPLLLRQ